MSPPELASGEPDPVVVVVNGTGLHEGWEALWNGQPRPTRFINSYQLSLTLKPEDVSSPSLNWISIRDPERDVIIRTKQAFWVYLAQTNNDIVYDETRSRIWIASPGFAAVKHKILLVDPTTGAIEQSVTLSAEPQKLVLTDDARFLYIGTPGRIFRLNTETLELDRNFEIPSTDSGSSAPDVASLLTVPHRPDQLIVSLKIPFRSPAYGGTIFFDNGVPGKDKISDAGGPAALYGWIDERTLIGGDFNTLYYAKVENGVTIDRALPGVLSYANPYCVLEAGLLYCASGAVFQGATGAYVRQYPAKGLVAALPAIDRAAFFDSGYQVSPSGLTFGPMVIVKETSSEFISSTLIPLIDSNAGAVIRWGSDGIIYRSRNSKLYPFKLP